MRQGDRHSRIVAWAKIVLPLAALALLSTLFLFAGQKPEELLPYAQAQIEELSREPRLVAPRYSGMTRDGSALEISAAEVRQGAQTTAEAQGLRAVLSAPSGLRTEMTAAGSNFSEAQGLIVLEGDVDLTRSDGMRMQSQRLEAMMQSGAVASPGAVSAQAPFGALNAGAMQVDPAQDGAVVHFTKGVKLVYDPAK